MKKVSIVFLHEVVPYGKDCESISAVCLTEEKATEWIKTHPLNKKMFKENSKLINPKWSYRQETFPIED